MPSRVISREGRPVMSWPSNQIEPLVGRKWPVIMLTKVVLPAPLAPIMPTVCNGGTATLMLRAATSEPKVFSQAANVEDRAHDDVFDVLRLVAANARTASRVPRAGTGW